MTIETRTSGPVTILDIHGKITIGEGSAEVRKMVRELLQAGKELLSIGVEKHQAAFSSGTWLTGTPLTYLAPW